MPHPRRRLATTSAPKKPNSSTWWAHPVSQPLLTRTHLPPCKSGGPPSAGVRLGVHLADTGSRGLLLGGRRVCGNLDLNRARASATFLATSSSIPVLILLRAGSEILVGLLLRGCKRIGGDADLRVVGLRVDLPLDLDLNLSSSCFEVRFNSALADAAALLLALIAAAARLADVAAS